MKYTVISKSGKVQQFYVLAVAELYRDINNGVLFTQDILIDDVLSVNIDK